jgi:hypothetical protein
MKEQDLIVSIMLFVALCVFLLIGYSIYSTIKGDRINEEIYKKCEKEKVYYIVSGFGNWYKAGTDYDKAIAMAGGRIVQEKLECKL